MLSDEIRARKIVYHRNGIAGVPFWVVRFDWDDEDCEAGTRDMLAIVFNTDEPCATAVFDFGRLAADDIDFGSNSWRGDNFDPALREAIRAHYATESDPADAPDAPAAVEIGSLVYVATGLSGTDGRVFASRDAARKAVLGAVQGNAAVREIRSGDYSGEVIEYPYTEYRILERTLEA